MKTRAWTCLLGLALAAAAVARSQEPAPSPGASAGAPVKPAGKLSIAVMPFAGKGVDSNSTGIIVEALASELLGTGKFRVMERSQMDKILQEQGLQTSGLCEGGECAVEMGRLLGIDQMIVGSVGLLGSTYVVNARLVDVATGEMVRTSRRSVSGQIDNVLDGLTRHVAQDLSEGLGEVPAPVAAPVPPAPLVAAPAPTSPPAPATPVAPAVAAKRGGSSWALWTVGGLAVAGGGAAAAYFLLADDGGESSPPPGPQSGSATFTWNKSR